MRQRFLLSLLVVLGLGILSVVYAGTIQDRKAEKTRSATGVEDAATRKAEELAAFLSSLKQDGLLTPRAQLQQIQERIDADPTLMDDPKLAVPLYRLQTNLVIDMVNAENLSGPERLRRLDEELARLGDLPARVKARYQEGGTVR